LRQSEDRRARNRAVKKSLHTYTRRVLESITAKDVDKCSTDFQLVTKKLDQAASKGIIHPNTAARTKSRLSARVKAMKQAAKA
jgi:small subunit ribosomal protein S20